MERSDQLYSVSKEEVETCLKIVMRNLNPEHWCDLIPEAQNQMLNEVDNFLQHKLISSKQNLLLLKESLNILRTIVSLEQQIRIDNILASYDEQKEENKVDADLIRIRYA